MQSEQMLYENRAISFYFFFVFFDDVALFFHTLETSNDIRATAVRVLDKAKSFVVVTSIRPIKLLITDSALLSFDVGKPVMMKESAKRYCLSWFITSVMKC